MELLSNSNLGLQIIILIMDSSAFYVFDYP